MVNRKIHSSSLSSSFRIAFVGFGPGGVAAYLEIVRRFHQSRLELLIFDPLGIVNSVAFLTQTDIMLANTSVGVTSLRADDPLDFYMWLSVRYPELRFDPEDFVPRRLVREYALERFGVAQRFAKSFGCRTTYIDQLAVCLDRTYDGFSIVCSNGSCFEVDAVILNIGASYRNPRPDLFGICGYIDNPYPEEGLTKALRNANTVLVMGTKLTAIDATLTILETLPNCRVVIASPSGTLPSVRDQLLVHRVDNFTANRILAENRGSLMRRLFVAAARDLRSLHAFDCAKDTVAKRDALEQLRLDIEHCAAGRNRWQYAIGSFIDQMNDLWPALSTEEQLLFKIKYKGFIARYISSFPIENARKIYNAMNVGKIMVIATHEVPRFEKALTDRFEGLHALKGWQFDAVVNATGVNVDSLRCSPLYQSLLAQGAELNAHGGLAVDTLTMRLKMACPDSLIFVSGALVSDNLIVTNYIRAAAIQARRIAENLACCLDDVSECSPSQRHLNENKKC